MPLKSDIPNDLKDPLFFFFLVFLELIIYIYNL